MAINTSLLVSAPVLQDYLVDKTTGAPLSGGKIYLYQDTSRTTFKNWYYQTGTPGNYTYITLPNPLTLSAVGTITDPNGNDVIPFFYPYNEGNQSQVQTYFIQVWSTNSDGSLAVLQFTRSNFPFTPPGTPSPSTVPTLRNYILNNEFWRNIGSINVSNITSSTAQILAPSQHAALSMPDIQFFKDVSGATDNISFGTFSSDNVLTGNITPEYFLRFQCTGTGSETYKYVQIPISLHLATLSGVTNATLSIQAINNSGEPGSAITLSILQFTGTGAVSPSQVVPYQTFTLTDIWTKFIVEGFTFPSDQGLSLGGGGDDAYYLQIRYPVGTVFDISIAIPELYLSTEIPTNNFDTYDQIDSIINTPRTGDIKITLNSPSSNSPTGYRTTLLLGWVACNNGTIGNASSNATARAAQETWPLFNMLWNFFANVNLASGGLFLPIFLSNGMTSTYGASAIIDYNANKQLALTQTVGYVFAGAAPSTTTETYTVSGNNLILSNAIPYFTGSPIMFTTTGTPPTGIALNTVYYAIQISSTEIQVATSYANALSAINVVLSGGGTGTQSVLTNLNGLYYGITNYAMTGNNLPQHTHTNPSAGQFVLSGTGGGSGSGAGSNLQTSGVTGGVTNFNGVFPIALSQPTVNYNVYMKL